MEKDSEKRPIVLYVDDVQANLMLFEASFENDYEVILAKSGKEALDILKEKEIHVLVSDQNMPGMTGNELLHRVADEYPDVMRFMITAYTDYEIVVEAINKGNLYGFFNKPYNINDVKHSINKSLEMRSLKIRNREMIVKLEKANEMMLGLDRSKTNFLISITEEIRNPINKIMTAIHIIKDKISSTELAELLDLLDVSVQRLEGFSEAARHLVRLNDPEFKLSQDSVSLKEVLDVGIIDKGNILSNEKITVNFNDSSEDTMVSGEYDLLQASFSALLGFIIDHTKSGSEIDLAIKNSDKTITLEIWSDGGSYSPKEKEGLLSLSSHKESFIKRDFRLELFLTSEIMRAHKGSLRFVETGIKSGFLMEFMRKG